MNTKSQYSTQGHEYCNPHCYEKATDFRKFILAKNVWQISIFINNALTKGLIESYFYYEKSRQFVWHSFKYLKQKILYALA